MREMMVPEVLWGLGNPVDDGDPQILEQNDAHSWLVSSSLLSSLAGPDSRGPESVEGYWAIDLGLRIDDSPVWADQGIGPLQIIRFGLSISQGVSMAMLPFRVSGGSGGVRGIELEVVINSDGMAI
ncbi:hypothetical protein FXO38_31759 [Capsicum annuum]|nr:hypothetical protein FXO38_31759 [Capsicum annuum]